MRIRYWQSIRIVIPDRTSDGRLVHVGDGIEIFNKAEKGTTERRNRITIPAVWRRGCPEDLGTERRIRILP